MFLVPYKIKKGTKQCPKEALVDPRWGKIVLCGTYHAEYFVNKQTKITALKRKLTPPQRQYDQHSLKYWKVLAFCIIGVTIILEINKWLWNCNWQKQAWLILLHLFQLMCLYIKIVLNELKTENSVAYSLICTQKVATLRTMTIF